MAFSSAFILIRSYLAASTLAFYSANKSSFNCFAFSFLSLYSSLALLRSSLLDFYIFIYFVIYLGLTGSESGFDFKMVSFWDEKMLTGNLGHFIAVDFAGGLETIGLGLGSFCFNSFFEVYFYV